jgi:putative transposase
MNTESNYEQLQEAIAQFRFSVIAELVNPYLDRGSLSELIRQKASREYDVPGIGRRRYRVACLKKWLAAYRSHGMEGLKPRRRRDAGVPRVLSEAEAAGIIRHLEEHPHLTARAAVKALVAGATINAMPSSSSLSRLVRSAGMDRENRIERAAQLATRKFEFFAPLECVQADAMHTFPVPDTRGR